MFGVSSTLSAQYHSNRIADSSSHPHYCGWNQYQERNPQMLVKWQYYQLREVLKQSFAKKWIIFCDLIGLIAFGDTRVEVN